MVSLRRVLAVAALAAAIIGEHCGDAADIGRAGIGGDQMDDHVPRDERRGREKRWDDAVESAEALTGQNRERGAAQTARREDANGRSVERLTLARQIKPPAREGVSRFRGDHAQAAFGQVL